jgi:hypothetical protein
LKAACTNLAYGAMGIISFLDGYINILAQAYRQLLLPMASQEDRNRRTRERSGRSITFSLAAYHGKYYSRP